MRSLRHTLWILAAVLVLLSQPFAFQTTSASQSQSPSATSSDTKPNQAKQNCTSNGTYVNSKGQTVPRPENCITCVFRRKASGISLQSRLRGGARSLALTFLWPNSLLTGKITGNLRNLGPKNRTSIL
jgi:hypothetical protein